MKKNLFLSVIAILLLAACQQTPEPVTIDLKAEEAAAMAMFRSFTNVMTVQDVDSMATFIAEDALICGSDPTEFFNKEETLNMWRELSEGPEIDFFFMDQNSFKIAADGNSAIAVSQFYIPMMVPKVPLRQVYNLCKVDGKWMVSFWSSSVIPKNEDLPKIVEALAAEE